MTERRLAAQFSESISRESVRVHLIKHYNAWDKAADIQGRGEKSEANLEAEVQELLDQVAHVLR